jgi:hypothetical protein
LSTGAFLLLAALAGAVGGVAWWLVLRPPTALLTAVGLGALFAFALFALEGLFGKPAA